MGHDGHDHPHDHEHGHGHGHHHHHDHREQHHHHEADTAAEHKHAAPASVAAFVVTCSDSRSPETDDSGAAIRRLLSESGHSVAGSKVILDDAGEIRAALEEGLAAGARVVVFTGGTGLSRRDVTIETLTPLFEKTITGFGELFRVLSFQQVGSAAMLSRAAAGVVKGAIVFALPGSPKAVRLAMEQLVLPELGHLVREVLR